MVQGLWFSNSTTGVATQHLFQYTAQCFMKLFVFCSEVFVNGPGVSFKHQ